jgi:hypothetical protein
MTDGRSFTSTALLYPSPRRHQRHEIFFVRPTFLWWNEMTGTTGEKHVGAGLLGLTGEAGREFGRIGRLTRLLCLYGSSSAASCPSIVPITPLHSLLAIILKPDRTGALMHPSADLPSDGDHGSKTFGTLKRQEKEPQREDIRYWRICVNAGQPRHWTFQNVSVGFSYF